MTQELLIPKVSATVQMATVNIPFKIVVHNINNKEPFDLDTVISWFKRRFFKTEKITAPWKARGTIKFYDDEHGYLDYGKFVEVPLIAQFIGPWWVPACWKRLELTGTMPNIGRFCFTGWGICMMDVYDAQNSTVLQVQGRVETEIVS